MNPLSPLSTPFPPRRHQQSSTSSLTVPKFAGHWDQYDKRQAEIAKQEREAALARFHNSEPFFLLEDGTPVTGPILLELIQEALSRRPLLNQLADSFFGFSIDKDDIVPGRMTANPDRPLLAPALDTLLKAGFIQCDKINLDLGRMGMGSSYFHHAIRLTAQGKKQLGQQQGP